MQSNNDINYRIQNLANLLFKASDQILQKQLSIGMAQFRILKTIQTSQQPLQRKIAMELSQTEASVSRQIKLLYRQQLLVAVHNPKDRRQHVISLTPKGIQVLEAAQSVIKLFQEPLVAGLSKGQQAALVSLLDNIEQRVKYLRSGFSR